MNAFTNLIQAHFNRFIADVLGFGGPVIYMVATLPIMFPVSGLARKAGGYLLLLWRLGRCLVARLPYKREPSAEGGFFLEQKLRQRVMWLAVDGNHENFARLFSGEFPLVEIFGGKAYKIRDHVYYLKRGEVFTIDGKTFLAFGGADSHDRFGTKVRSLAWGGGSDYVPPRKEGVDRLVAGRGTKPGRPG